MTGAGPSPVRPGQSSGHQADGAPRPRVLMVVRLFHPWIGGTERQAHKLARKLREQGTDVAVVTGWWFRGTPQSELIDGVQVFRNHTMWEGFGIRGLRKFGGYLYILSLSWYLWRHRATYDVLHVHGLSYHTAVVAIAGRLWRRPTLVKLANSGQASDLERMRSGQQLALSRFLIPTALKIDRFVATNERMVAELRAAGVPPGRIVRLPNGVETDEFLPKADHRLHDPATIIYVGRLHPQKGIDVLLEAMAQLRTMEAMVPRLVLVGDGPVGEELRLLARRLDLADRVLFVGATERVAEHLRQADIFVLPSRSEGLSNALLEAMASGLPVVATSIPGNVDVITNGRDGLLVAVDDPEALASACAGLLADRSRREELGRAARMTVEARYSLDRVARDYRALYRTLVPLGTGTAHLRRA